MMDWWHYLLLVNLYLVVFFGFYKVFLHKETFFQLNRVYLVSGSLLSFFIPLMQSDWIRDLFITRHVHQAIYSTVSPQLIYSANSVENNPITFGQIVTCVYIAGALLLLGRLVYQLLLLKKLVSSDDAPSAFSFFKKIKVDSGLPNQQTIIEHEQVHSRQWHSADVLLIEAVMIINWFNPVVYLYRKAIKHVHEYIADRKAIETGASKSEYAMLLLSQTFGTVPHELTNNFFNHSLLKQRILMLNQNESKRRALLKYGLSAPLFAAMLILSSATVNNSKLIRIINKNTEQAFIRKVKFSIGGDAKLVTIVTDHAAIPQNNRIAKDNGVKTETTTTMLTTMDVRKDSISGEEDGVAKLVAENAYYLDKANENHTSGRTIVRFNIDKDGNSTDAKSTLIADTSHMAMGSKKIMKIFVIRHGANDSLNALPPTTGMRTFAAHQLVIKMDGKTMTHDELSRLSANEIELMKVIKAPNGKDSIMLKMRSLNTPTKNKN